jgi:myo-inositol-1(or 4)-monophosphatase
VLRYALLDSKKKLLNGKQTIMNTLRMTTGSSLVNVMVAAAYKAGRSLVRDFGEVEHLQVSKKGLGDFVSTADHHAEEILMTELKKARPGFGFLIEESGVVAGSDTEQTWIVDPLDGTSNFLHGIPHFSISIALQVGDEIVAGVVYNPAIDELYWAEKGKGAFLNKRRLRVSGRKHLDESLIGAGTPYSRHGNSKQFLALMEKLMPHVGGIRRFGSAALDLAYVAAGRYDGYFEMGLSAWDIAAGILLVKEAGGYVSEINGGKDMLKSGSILAANPAIFNQLGQLIRR